MATFKTRARALDMLGRQQIAGIPTAISELFKNAHDAYANRAEVDFYRADGLFVLRDDGLGMTEADFENRWLTIATESKVDNRTGMSAPSVPVGFEIRPTMGEKGIGRLSIGVIGPQVLVLSRAIRNGSFTPLIAAFINWRVFEIPGINLEDIRIPVATFANGVFPTRIDLADLLSDFEAGVQSVAKYMSAAQLLQIESEIKSFAIDPVEIDQLVPHLSLVRESHGTHFYIRPTYDNLTSDLDEPSVKDVVAPLVKVLIGFTNTMTPGHMKPRIVTAFRNHDEILGSPVDVIAESEFWTPKEFDLADHHFEGAFDDFGQYAGKVTIFGKEPVAQSVPWLKAMGRPTDCGPFKINLAYIQGAANDSKLAPQLWAQIRNKADRIGGLYIYRDGIRVLPYGNNDYDWLDIEKNRTKSASYYFFSHRRMFGVIEISQMLNGNLNEKAGREGFRENKAYRQFRDILKAWLEQTAADFFRGGGVYTDSYEETKDGLNRVAAAREKRDKQVRERTRTFVKNLDELFVGIDEQEPEKATAILLENVRLRLAASANLVNPETAALAFLDAESAARRRLSEIVQKYRLAKPKGIGLSREASQKWIQYQRESLRLDAQVFSVASREIETVIGELARDARVSVDRRRRIERSLADLTTRVTRTAREESRQTDATLDEVKTQVVKLTRDAIGDVRESTAHVLKQFASTDFTGIDDAILVQERVRMEDSITQVSERSRDILENVRAQLLSLNFKPGPDGRLIGSLEETEQLEQRLLQLEEQRFEDIELLQLGSALQIVNHEFRSSVVEIRRNLNKMKAWADINAGLGALYDGLRNAFEHLDGYLTLFTPLQRRLYRSKTNILGGDIGDFVEKLFVDRLRRHGIRLEQTSQFRHFAVVGYPSTFYPVFVNLVDNAIYWLGTIRASADLVPTIRLDADSAGFTVSDNGPGIPYREMEQVFLAGYTHKPGGHGLGLYIARQTLREQGYDLSIDHSPLHGTVFHITALNDEKVEI